MLTVCKHQAYMEGSSWEATVVDDIVFLGGDNSSHNEHMRDHFGTRFMFGCQNKETGTDLSPAWPQFLQNE